MRYDLKVTLETPVCVSASGRSVGGFESLSYIPGRVFWGVAGTRAYGEAHADAFRLFQRGDVRFFDAVPSHLGQRTFPTPQSWHREKYGAQRVYDLCVPSAEPGERPESQPKVLEANALTPDGLIVKAGSERALKTSIDPTGRARDGLLFSMSAIPAGTVLHTRLEGAEADLQLVMRWLTGGSIHVGRSRSAEFGHVRVERLAEPAPDLAPGAAAATKRLAFLCLSRVALRDPATGQPTLLPTADAFGIAQPNWVFNERLSFVRTTRYAPFSGKLQRPDLERHVLERGSVVVFTGDAPESPEAVRARLAGGVGLYRNQGLGDVSVAPEWLTARIPKAPTEVVRTATRTTPPSDALFAWASAERDVRAAARTAVEWAEEKARSLARHQLPPAQWGRVRTLAREARIRGDGQWLKRQLDELMRADTPLDRPDDPAKKRVDDRTRQQKSTVGSRLWASARPELLSLFPEASPEKAAEWTAMPERIEMLASRAMRSGTESQREGGR